MNVPCHGHGCQKWFQTDSAAEGFCPDCKATLAGVPKVKASCTAQCGAAHADHCTLTASSVINTKCASCRKFFEVPRECPECESTPVELALPLCRDPERNDSVFDLDGRCVTRPPNDKHFTPEQKQLHMEQIVTAVNAHKGLVAVLEEIAVDGCANGGAWCGVRASNAIVAQGGSPVECVVRGSWANPDRST